jgi:hypothetical protein
MSFQALAPDTSIKLIAAAATDVLIIASPEFPHPALPGQCSRGRAAR